jgi:hypothetical protein
MNISNKMNSVIRDAVWDCMRMSIEGFVWKSIRDNVVNTSVKDTVWMSVMNNQIEILQTIIHDDTDNYFIKRNSDKI